MSPFFPPECPIHNFWGIFCGVFQYKARLWPGLLGEQLWLGPSESIGGEGPTNRWFFPRLQVLTVFHERHLSRSATSVFEVGFGSCWQVCQVERSGWFVFGRFHYVNVVQDLHSDQVQKFAGLLSHSRSKCSICWGIKNSQRHNTSDSPTVRDGS